MINLHCNQRLVYISGRFIDSRLKYHMWRCKICKRVFRQNVRLSKSISQPEAA